MCFQASSLSIQSSTLKWEHRVAWNAYILLATHFWYYIQVQSVFHEGQTIQSHSSILFYPLMLCISKKQCLVLHEIWSSQQWNSFLARTRCPHLQQQAKSSELLKEKPKLNELGRNCSLEKFILSLSQFDQCLSLSWLMTFLCECWSMFEESWIQEGCLCKVAWSIPQFKHSTALDWKLREDMSSQRACLLTLGTNLTNASEVAIQILLSFQSSERGMRVKCQFRKECHSQNLKSCWFLET